MPLIDQMMPSKYLKREDFPTPKLMTIDHFEQLDLAMEGKPADMQWAMFFKETDKPLILKPTNMNLAAAALGSRNTDDWRGKKIVLFDDPSVIFGKKAVGGIRVRAPKGNGMRQAAAQSMDEANFEAGSIHEMEDDLPFEQEPKQAARPQARRPTVTNLDDDEISF